MGEIGLDRREYLFDIMYWELVLILRGYSHRHREEWSMTRWMTWNLMSAQAGKEGMQGAGLFKITDLIKFPWEKPVPIVPKEVQDELQAEMKAINENLKKNQKS